MLFRSGAKRRIDTGAESDQYLPGLGWTPDGKLFYQRLNRRQNTFEMVVCEPGGAQHTVYEERSQQYVERASSRSILFVDKDRFQVRHDGQGVLFLLVLLTFSLHWSFKNFGNIGLNEIIFTLNMPLKEASAGFVADYFRKAFFPAAGIFAVELLLALYPFKRRCNLKLTIGKKFSYRWRLVPLSLPFPVFFPIVCIWMAGLVYLADQKFEVISYAKSQMMQSALIEEEYVSPNDVNITFPKQKRNLIYIFVESLESSMQNQENGGVFPTNYIPELTELAKENISFSHSDKIEGAAVAPASGWTIAGLVAETADRKSVV